MFRNRKDAGEQLGRALEQYRNQDVLVLGIPRGGAETAYYVAKYLNADLSLVITRKMGYPFNPEAAFGAVAEDGSIYISEAAKNELSTEEINAVLQQQKQEIERRIQTLRRGKPLPPMKGRTVIITDDGIATGATLFATIALCKKNEVAKIVVASPIAGKRMETILRSKVDDFVILEIPPFYSAVSQGYEDFYNLTDEEALAFMDKWEREHNAHKV
ncbi:MAG: phosphoribosyltransferase family protein [Chryseosolibacter sp.]